ncbi:MAG TPA: hypothetical protein PLM77_01650 [Phycisphaerae bacterium]|nr:hypothetical protein [Phycisphaerae bacterium]
MGRTKFLARAVVVLAVLATAGAVWAAEFFVEAPPTNLSPGVVVRQDLDGTYEETAGTWGNTGIKSTKAPTQGIYSRYSASAGAKCEYTFVPNETGDWTLDLTWGPTTNGDPVVAYTVYDADGTTVLGSGTVNMDQGYGHHAWNPLNKGAGQNNVYSLVACQRYKVELFNEVLNTENNGGNRVMGDCLRIAKASGCNDTPVVTVQAPLLDGDTVVTVLGVKTGSPAATEVRVYDLDSATPGTPIATAAASGSASVAVSVPALVSGHRIAATQVVNGVEGCTCNAPAVTVGCVAVPVPVLGSGDATKPQVLAPGGTTVSVLGVDPNATAVTVYADGTQIGIANLNGNGSSDSKVDVTTTPLSAGATITARQQIRSCLSDASAGVVVGDCAQVPAVDVAGMVDEGRTQLRIVGVTDNADAVTIYKQGTPDQVVTSVTSPTKDGKGAVVVTVPALVLGERYYATQTISSVEGCKTSPSLRRVMAAGMIEDFEDLTPATANAQNPPAINPLNRVWYNASNYGLAVTEGSVGTLFGSKCLRITDNGWTNGLYAVYDQIVPADGDYHLQVDMLIDEAGITDPVVLDGITSYFVGVIKNGSHRPTLGTIASCEYVGAYNGPLTPGQDGATETQAYVVLTATIPQLAAGDSLLIAFSTDVSSYSISKTFRGTLPAMRVDNIRLNPGPRPCRPEDVPVVSIITPAPPTTPTPLEAGNTQVTVDNIDPMATEVSVYEYDPALGVDPSAWVKIGSGIPGGVTRLVINTAPLTAGKVIVATQTKSVCDPPEIKEGVKQIKGPVVGTGQNTAVRLTLGIREDASLTGPIGADGVVTAGAIEWLGASSAIANAPQGKLITPSANWQTVTFYPVDPDGDGPLTADPIRSYANGNGALDGAFGILEHLAVSIAGPPYNTGRYVLYIDNVKNGDVTIADFDTTDPQGVAPTVGSAALFRAPRFSGSTDTFLLTWPNISTVTSEKADGPGNSLKLEFQFSSDQNNHWVRLTTARSDPGMPYQNPKIDLTQPISFRVLLFACHSPFADADDDGDVDQEDFGILQACLYNFGGPACSCFDTDGDDEIDADDLSAFINCALVSGPDVIPDQWPANCPQ